VMFVGSDQGWPGITPVQVPATLPDLPVVAVLAIGVAALAAWVSPPPPQRAAAAVPAREKVQVPA